MAESNLMETVFDPKASVKTVIDAAGQVRVCVSHCVMIVPSLHTAAWLKIIEDAAQAKGWDMLVVGLDNEIPITRPTETLAVLLDAAALDRLAVDRFAIISTGLLSTAEAAEQLFKVEPGRRLTYASRILALGHILPREVTSHYSDGDLSAGKKEFNAFAEFSFQVPLLAAVLPDSELRRSVENAFRCLVSPEPGVTAKWSADLFSYNSRNPKVVDGCIDVTGRQRPLVFGTYVCLPPGKWRVEVRFAVDKDTARHQYRLEWGDMASYTVIPFSPSEPGYYSLSATYDWSYVAAAEVQIAISESSLGGQFQFMGASLERVQPNDDDEPFE
jgi:hypothetical protein